MPYPTSSSDEVVTLAELARRFGLDKSNARKWLQRNGFKFEKVRSEEARNQLILALRREDAEAAIELRRQQGYAVDGRRSAVSPQGRQELGYFYVVQVVPEFSETRIKLGFTTHVDARLASYRTVAPNARVVRVWPCRAAWEEAAIDCATSNGCRRIGDEVYDCDNLQEVLERLDRFFQLMPALA
jgi:transposase-like protein